MPAGWPADLDRARFQADQTHQLAVAAHPRDRTTTRRAPVAGCRDRYLVAPERGRLGRRRDPRQYTAECLGGPGRATPAAASYASVLEYYNKNFPSLLSWVSRRFR